MSGRPGSPASRPGDSEHGILDGRFSAVQAALALVQDVLSHCLADPSMKDDEPTRRVLEDVGQGVGVAARKLDELRRALLRRPVDRLSQPMPPNGQP